MDSLSQIRSIILQNRSILDPALRTTCTLIGFLMISAATYSLISPQTFSSSFFYLPLPPFSPSPKETKTKNNSKASSPNSSTPPAANPRAWLISFAGREAAIGLTILLLSWLGEWRILSLMFIPLMLVGLADTAAVAIYGEEGAWMVHGVPSLCLSWVVPVGLVLYGGI